MLSSLAAARPARAEVVPAPIELPAKLTLDDALRIFRSRGFDLLIAEAAIVNAQGDQLVAGASPNPAVNVGIGRVIGNYDTTDYTNAGPTTPLGKGPCIGCSANSYSLGITDQAAIEDALSGKRGLRLRVARNALAAARLARVDAERSIAFQVKAAYFQVALASAALEFAKDVQRNSVETVRLTQLKFDKGQVDLGVLARIDTAKLEGDQAVDSALQNFRAARVALAFLLGVRGHVPDFSIDEDTDKDVTRVSAGVLKFEVPGSLATADELALMRDAFEHRPDLRAYGYQKERAGAAIALAKRQRFPDISFSVQYNQTGSYQNAVQPPTLMFGLSAPIPLLYQQQGEIRKAEADYSLQALSRAKAEAQVVSDVETAYAAFATSRALVTRMETTLLDRARTARDITKRQYDGGTASLIDYLDAQRTYIATNLEYLQDLTNYWTAVAQLEQAVGMELRK